VGKRAEDLSSPVLCAAVTTKKKPPRTQKSAHLVSPLFTKSAPLTINKHKSMKYND
jgi:hypothetical protein